MNAYVAAKSASFLKKHWKEFVLAFIFLLFLPVILATSLVVAQTTPGVDNKVLKMYSNIANDTSREGCVIDWKNLISIDALRLQQDFSKATKRSVRELANNFVEKISTKNGTIYRVKSLERVMSEMGFTDEEKEAIRMYREIGANLIGGKGGVNGEGILVDGNIGEVQTTLSQNEFIEKVSKGAISTYKKYKVLPSISIAQAILESGWGDSGLTQKANNLFGIKAIGGWTGKYVVMMTTEWYGGTSVQLEQPFRAYDSWDGSIEDHAVFLVENSRYGEAGFFSASDYRGQAIALQAAGYATDPQYAQGLCDMVQMYGLDKYDKVK